MNAIPTNAIRMLRHALVALTLIFGAAAPAPLHANPSDPTPQTRLPLVSGRLHANNAPPVRAGAPVLVGGVLQDVIGNRSRLIQVSFIAIVIGIFILWKK